MKHLLPVYGCGLRARIYNPVLGRNPSHNVAPNATYLFTSYLLHILQFPWKPVLVARKNFILSQITKTTMVRTATQTFLHPFAQLISRSSWPFRIRMLPCITEQYLGRRRNLLFLAALLRELDDARPQLLGNPMPVCQPGA